MLAAVRSHVEAPCRLLRILTRHRILGQTLSLTTEFTQINTYQAVRQVKSLMPNGVKISFGACSAAFSPGKCLRKRSRQLPARVLSAVMRVGTEKLLPQHGWGHVPRAPGVHKKETLLQ